MSVVPPRHVVVLNVANHDLIFALCGRDAANEAMRLVQEQAIACTLERITLDNMRMMRTGCILARLDELSTDEFLQAVVRMRETMQGLTVPADPDLELEVVVGAVTERAQRESVNELTTGLLSYMEHAHSPLSFLTGSEDELCQQLDASGIDHVSLGELRDTDPFTGLLRPARFAMTLARILSQPSLVHGGSTLLYFDLDEFKSFNRVFGRMAGDELLLFITDQLRKEFPGDLMTHVAIDRFVVMTSKRDIEETCVRIHHAVRDFSPVFAPHLRCGMYALRPGEPDANIAMDYAKVACDSIKGRYDTVCTAFDDAMRERFAMTEYVAHRAEKAVSMGWIQPFYQPVVDAQTGVVCGWEALCRWVDPVQGVLSPATFIPVLEETHLVHKIDACVVGQVCQDIAKARTAGREVAPVSINLSRLDFQLCDIFDVVTGLCRTWDVPHELLVIEVTESALSSRDTFLREQMDRFRAAGFEVWMDDFGSGYSTLNLLKDYEFDVLKVDMEFLNGMEDNDRSRTIVAAVIAMARKLNLRTLVEGVRTHAQRQYLRELGCDMLQGYLFDIPRRLGDPLFNRGPY